MNGIVAFVLAFVFTKIVVDWLSSPDEFRRDMVEHQLSAPPLKPFSYAEFDRAKRVALPVIGVLAALCWFWLGKEIGLL